MKITAVIQQDETGAVLVVNTSTATISRQLRAWQGGSIETLRLREIYMGDRGPALAAAWDHRLRGAWFTADALEVIRAHITIGSLPDLARGIDEEHQAHEAAARAGIDGEQQAGARAGALARLRGTA